KLFLPIKFNLGPKPSGLAYRREVLSDEERHSVLSGCTHLSPEDLEKLGKQLSRLCWLGEATENADVVLAEHSKQCRGRSKIDQAAEWLLRFLADYAYPSKEIFQAGKEQGFTEDNLYKAKQQLGKDVISASNAKRLSALGEWWWGPGHWSHWKLRPEPAA